MYLDMSFEVEGFDKFLATQVASVFVFGLSLMYDGNVLLQTVTLKVRSIALTALISLPFNRFGPVSLLMSLYTVNVPEVFPTYGTLETLPRRVMVISVVPDQTLF